MISSCLRPLLPASRHRRRTWPPSTTMCRAATLSRKRRRPARLGSTLRAADSLSLSRSLARSRFMGFSPISAHVTRLQAGRAKRLASRPAGRPIGVRPQQSAPMALSACL